MQLHKRLLPLTMWSLVALFYGYQYLLQVSPGVMTNELMHDLGLNATELGIFAACYFYTYAGMQIPVGLLVDRFGARKPLAIAIIICAAGAIVFGTAPNFMVTALGRLMIGLGGAFAIVSGLYIAANWLPLKYFALLTGAIGTLGMLGASFGQSPLALMINDIGWREAMIILGFCGIILAILSWCTVRDRARTPQNTPHHHLLFGLKKIIENPQIWWLAIYGGLMFMPISVFGSLWGVPFLMHKYHINNTIAGNSLIGFFIGLAIGFPFWGWLSDYIKRRKSIMLISSLGSLAGSAIVLYCNIAYGSALFFLFIFGFFAGGSLVCFAAAREIDRSKSTGATMGFMNTVNMIGGAIMQPLCGLIMDLLWNGAIQNDTRIYTLHNFQVALSVIPITIILSLISLLWIKETNCREVA